MELTKDQEALLKELGMLDVVKSKMKKSKVLPPAKHNKIPAKEYNLRYIHHCRLCGAEWREDIRMSRSENDVSVLVASAPLDDEPFVPDLCEDKYPRTCCFCSVRLADVPAEKLIKATMVLSNRIVDSAHSKSLLFNADEE